MPVLDIERRGTRSALHYRPIEPDQAGPVPVISRAHRLRLDTRITTVPAAPDDLDSEEQAPGRHTSTSAPRRTVPPARTRRRIPALFFVSLGLVVTQLLWVGITQLVSWGTNELNTLKYGDPRTFQIDEVVGGDDSTRHPSHFLAVNLRGQVTILGFPAGDPGRVRVLATTSILSPNAAQAVVTLAFIDVNHNGRPDMLIYIDGVESVLVNDQGTFRPPTPVEQQQVLNELRQ